MRIIIYLSLFLFCSVASMAQDKLCQMTIDSLERRLKAAEIAAQKYEKVADDLTYLLVAKEMALRSMTRTDTSYQMLLAVQAHRFHMVHGGNEGDIEIYQALYGALMRTNNPLIKMLKPSYARAENYKFIVTTMMVNELCTRVNRNMNAEEWNRYAWFLPYEATCPDDLGK